MDEAELLSTKLGIMVEGGVFRCMGSPKHIKNKYFDGFEIQIRVKKPLASELEDFALQYDFQGDMQSMVSLTDAIQKLKRADFNQLILD